jgi:hypothetical protein
MTKKITTTKPTPTKPATPTKAKATTGKAATNPPVQPIAPPTSVPPTPVTGPEANATATDATDATPTPKAAPKATPTKTKPAKAAKPKRVSALDAAVQVLKQAGKPMTTPELVAAMKEQKLWVSPNGKTPHATLHAAISTEIKKKGTASRFRKAERGHFTLA